MTKKELMIKAHKMTKEIKNEYPAVDYKFQLSLCLTYLYENEGENKMVELKGSEKQVKWAMDIRNNIISEVERQTNFITEFDVITKVVNSVKEAINNIEDAKFFIDNRNMDLNFYSSEFFNKFGLEYPKRKFISNMIRLEYLEKDTDRNEDDEERLIKTLEYFKSL